MLELHESGMGSRSRAMDVVRLARTKRGRMRTIIMSIVWSLFVVFGSLSTAAGAAAASSPVLAIPSRESLILKNVGSKPIIAVEGTFTYTSRGGTVANPRWGQSFAGAFFPNRKLFNPSEEITLPPIVPPHDAAEKIEYGNVSVRGVLFADGSSWGEKDGRLHSNALDRLQKMISHLETTWK